MVSASLSWLVSTKEETKVSEEKAGFFSFFRPSLSSDSEDVSPVAKKRISRAYDIADVVERGCARETAVDYMVPLKKSSKLHKFDVFRSGDRKEYKLYSKDKTFLMCVQVNFEKNAVDFFLYQPGTDLFDQTDPYFSMTFSNEKKSWMLKKCSCECSAYTNQCCEAQEVANIEHYQEAVGEGLFNILHAQIPAVNESGRGDFWCTKKLPSLSTLVNGKTHHKAVAIENKRPSWHEQASSLVLEFKGRTIAPSAKNFQLCLAEDDEIICQFGKLGPQMFALDVKFPLSIVQAFAMAVSTMFWE